MQDLQSSLSMQVLLLVVHTEFFFFLVAVCGIFNYEMWDIVP